jgi:hypothetical protein
LTFGKGETPGESMEIGPFSASRTPPRMSDFTSTGVEVASLAWGVAIAEGDEFTDGAVGAVGALLPSRSTSGAGTGVGSAAIAGVAPSAAIEKTAARKRARGRRAETCIGNPW